MLHQIESKDSHLFIKFLKGRGFPQDGDLNNVQPTVSNSFVCLWSHGTSHNSPTGNYKVCPSLMQAVTRVLFK